MTQNGNAWVSHLVAFKADNGSTDDDAAERVDLGARRAARR